MLDRSELARFCLGNLGLDWLGAKVAERRGGTSEAASGVRGAASATGNERAQANLVKEELQGRGAGASVAVASGADQFERSGVPPTGMRLRSFAEPDER